MLAALKRNDEVVTTGGLIGRVVELGDKVVTLEIAPERPGKSRARTDRRDFELFQGGYQGRREGLILV